MKTRKIQKSVLVGSSKNRFNLVYIPIFELLKLKNTILFDVRWTVYTVYAV